MKLLIPCRTISEANCTQPWRTKHARHKKQKQLVALYMLPVEKKLPAHIKLTRIAPRILDSDNLPVSMKYFRDAIADYFLPGLAPGRADSSDRLTWEYEQRKGTYGVEIEVIQDN